MLFQLPRSRIFSLATKCPVNPAINMDSFNPRSRMGSDLLNSSNHLRCISQFQSTLPHIRSDPGHMSLLYPKRRVSIHAPAWGATKFCADGSAVVAFQSTLPHGERLAVPTEAENRTGCFNPRSRMGSDSAPLTWSCLGCGFNPRSRMGSDPGSVGCGTSMAYFNPRSRMGSDWGRYQAERATLISGFQSTLPHGERPSLTN